jgi:hypothetical protein
MIPFRKSASAAEKSLQKHFAAVSCLWVATIGLSLIGYSRHKQLWLDELLFKKVATQRNLYELWTALSLGISSHPPLSHLAARVSLSLFGSSPLTLRLVSLLGVLTMLVVLPFAVRKYTTPLYAALALVMPVTTGLMYYGFDATPYGVLYGCLAVTMYCWISMGYGNEESLGWNFAFGVALAATLACHFYSVFVLPAFLVGEYVRIRRRHAVSRPTLVAMCCAAASFLFYVPIAISIRNNTARVFWAKPSASDLQQLFEENLRHLPVELAVFLLVIGIFEIARSNFVVDKPLSPQGDERRDREVIALGLGLLALPVIAWVPSMTILKAWTGRYGLHGLLGLSLLIPLLSARLFKSDRVVGLALLLACATPAAFTVGRGIFDLAVPTRERSFLQPLEAAVLRCRDQIVVSDPSSFIELTEQSPILKSHLIYLWDDVKELQFTGIGGPPRKPRKDKNWTSYFSGVIPFENYSHKDDSFLLLTVPEGVQDGVFGWMRTYLKANNRWGRELEHIDPYIIVEVKPAS